MRLEAEEDARQLQSSLSDRFDGFGYGMFLLVIFGVTLAILKSYGWPMGIFTALLMLAILELSYRLYSRN